MEKKKKIIASAVFAVFVIGIGVFAKTFLFASEETIVDKIPLGTPDIDENSIEDVSKMNSYDLENVQSINDTTDMIDEREEDVDKWKNELKTFDPFARGQGQLDPMAQEKALEQQQVDAELLALMQMQEQMMANEAANPAVQYQNTGQQQQIPGVVEPEKELSLQEVRDRNERSNDFFQGAGGLAHETNTLDLIPGETVDQGILTTGSTAAIRVKRAIRIKNPALTIPKGAVLYGKVSFSGQDRLQIDIVSYKFNNKLSPVKLVIYDFDGREGIHLGNNSWPKIPSKVAKEVLGYVKQRGTQASTFGGDNGVDLNEARDIAIISALKETTEELLEKQRVFMPKKYNLWIHILTKKQLP